MKAVLLAVAAMLLLAVPPAEAGNFGRLLPNLAGLSSHTGEEIAELARIQRDPNADPLTNLDNPSGFTYFGQFVDHDLTRDTSPLPALPVDPVSLINARTFRFDLDSVYGGGPSVSPPLYEADRKRVRVQAANVNGVPDLPRVGSNPAAAPAIIGDPRNDESQIISQLHLAFLKAHNKLIDRGLSFNEAQKKLRWHYQRAVVDDFVPHILRPDIAEAVRTGKNEFPVQEKVFDPLREQRDMTPVEFAVAAYRFGHSMVRLA